MQSDVNRKNIWIFNQYAITPEQAGGSRHYSIGRCLAARGYNVTLFASGFNYQKREELKCDDNQDFKIEIKDGVRFIWVKTIPYKKNNWKRIVNMLSYCRQCFRIYKKLLEEDQIESPGLIIGSAVHLFAVWTGYRISRKLNAKFIMEVRDLWPMTLVEFRKGLKYHPIVFFFGLLDKYLAKRALRIVSVLPGASLYYQKYGIPKDHIAWIPNGVDMSLFNTSGTDSAPIHHQNIPFSNSSGTRLFKIVYTGTFGMEAQLKTLLETAHIIGNKQLPIHFELTGSGEKFQELIELKEKLSLTNVTFQKPVNKDQIPSILASADALWIGTRNVQNLYKYGFSFNKLFEYLASGKPILFSIDSAYNPVKEADAGIIVPPENPQALSEAIIRLYEMSPEERFNMGQRGISHVRENYGFEKLTDQFENLFTQLEPSHSTVTNGLNA